MTDSDLEFLTRDDLARDLRTLGVSAGDTIMIHSSMRAVGPLLNGPDTLIAALLEVLGGQGTLMAYAGWNSAAEDLVDEDGRVLDVWRDHLAPFDIAQSRAVRANGVLPEFIRTTLGARRSANPGASMVALGARADLLCADHPMDYGYGPGSPLAKLVDAKGRVLMVGAPWDTMTLVHHADHLARLSQKRVIRVEVPIKTNEGVTWRFIEEFDTTEPVIDGMPANYIEEIVTAFVKSGRSQQGLVGHAPSLLVDADPILHFAIDWLETWDKASGGGAKR